MTFRVGQKVVCIDDSCALGYVFIEPYPKKNGIYTIVGFGQCRDGTLGLRLDIDPSWNYFSRRFRPIVERKTDISIFTKMLISKRVNA